MLNTTQILTLLALYGPLFAIILGMYISVFRQQLTMTPESVSLSFSPEIVSKINELDKHTSEKWLNGK